MTQQEAVDRIVEQVENMQGCKATELAAEVSLISVFAEHRHTDLVEEAIRSGRLIELEYALPEMSYRMKSFLLPARSTQVAIRWGQDGEVFTVEKQ